MQVGGALANVIVRGELPSAAGQGVSPVRVAPAIVLGKGVNVVVGAFGSMVVEANSSIVVDALDDAPLSPRLNNQTSPEISTAPIGISNTYMPVRLRFT